MATGSAAADAAATAHSNSSTGLSRRRAATLAIVALAIFALSSPARHLTVESDSVGAGRTYQAEVSSLSRPPAQESSVGDEHPSGRERDRKTRPGERTTSHDGRVHFVEPGSRLHDLVRKWNGSDITVSEAAQDLNRIVSNDEYTDHKPSEGILFIKTHKTGSSTVASVLRSLSAVSPRAETVKLPAEKSLIGIELQLHNLRHPVLYHRNKLHGTRTWDTRKKLDRMLNFTSTDGSRGAPYDVWAVHSNFDSVMFDDFLPSTSRVVSIMRDPGTAMRSACAFFRNCGCPADRGNASVWNEFVLSDEGRYFFLHKKKRVGCQLNHMTRQIVGGIDDSVKYSNAEEVQDWIEESKTRHHVVLVMERMVESMLVLWHEYGLHPLDVVFSSLKVRSKGKEEDEESIKAENAIRELSPSDSLMYRHANQRLDSLLGTIFANTTARENAVQELEAMNDMLAQTCGSVTYMDKHDWVQKYDNLTIDVPLFQRFCVEKLSDGPQWHHLHYLTLKQDGMWPDD